jgi:asparagine synthase (glutamine-hydrolysing)
VTAKHFKTDHHELVCDINAVELVSKIAPYFDEPFGDASMLPTYLVSRLARTKVTMALSGDGGDELFAGYDHYARMSELWRMEQFPFSGNLLRGSSKFLSIFAPSWSRRMARACGRLGLSDDESMLEGVSIFSRDLRRGLWNSAIPSLDSRKPFETFYQAFQSGKHFDRLNRLLYTDLKTYLVDDILTKVDRMSMANSLEARVPLLDHKLVEYVFSLPSEMKLKGSVRKYIFRKVAEKIVPAEILKGKKMGFGLPLKEWFRGPLSAMARDMVLGARIRDSGIFDHPTLARMFDEHAAGICDHGEHLWALMIFAMWYEMNMKSIGNNPGT